MNPPRALVIGGSLGGLFAANFLKRIGWNVTVYERATAELSERGAGLGTQGELFEALRHLGIRVDGFVRSEVRSRIAIDPFGHRSSELPIRSVTTAWDCIYRALKDALPVQHYQPGKRLKSLQQDAHRICAAFEDGSYAEGELLVGADGMNSTARDQLIPTVLPRYAGYIAWRGVAEETDLPASLRGLLLNHMTFCFPDGELVLSVPMPPRPTSPSRRRCQFSWFRRADVNGTLRDMCTDAQGNCHGMSIPPPLIRQKHLEKMRADAKALLAPQLATLIRLAKQPLLQPIYDLESPRVAFGRAVLLGDAAFVARPHVGTGVTKAALDAQCLADAVLMGRGDIETALIRYERERVPYGTSLVARGRYLGAYLGASPDHRPHSGPDPIRDPESFMREFGAAGTIQTRQRKAR